MNAIVGNLTQDKNNKVTAIIRGIFLAFLLTLVSFLLFSLLIAFTGIPESAVNLIVIITTVVSLVVAGIYSSRKMGSQGLKNGIIIGLSYTVIVYLISSILYRNFLINLNTLIMLIICVVSASAGGIFGVNFRSKRHRWRK